MKPAHRTAIIVAVYLMSLPVLAFAGVADGVEPENFDDLLRKLIYGGILAVGERLWQWLRHKGAAEKVRRYVDYHAAVQKIAQGAIDYAEELAHQAKKRLEAFTSEMKETAALARGLEEFEQAAKAIGLNTKRLKQDAKDELKKVILSRLGAGRKRATPAVAATSASGND